MGKPLSSIIMVFLVTVCLFTSSFAEGRSYTRGMSKHIVKTIKVPGGDVVDCIDIYKQPAFNHPLLMNHTLQIEPSKHKGTSKNGVNLLKQPWKKYGSCPQGSIPILRQRMNTNRHFRRRFAPPAQQLGPDYHHAVIHFSAVGTIRGAYGTLNTWNPTTGPQDFSLSQIWVVAGGGGNLNSLEAGWHVYPNYTRDRQTRLFIYWTKDGYQSTGCYNLQCEGFVQTNKEIVLGSPMELSIYGGQQIELEVGIEKEKDSGNWWLFVHKMGVGYWPASLMTSIADVADYAEWGGEVYDSTGGGGKHTSNQMGNGHFSNEGFQKSSYTRGIKYIDTSGAEIHPTVDNLKAITTIPACYDLHADNSKGELFLYFGGPGCQ